MSLRTFYLMGLVAVVLGQDIPPDFSFRGAAQSISAELRSPTFIPYSRPAQKVEEFIAAGDSYTAGTGCNGLNEIIAGDALRGKRSYPMQMSTDKDNWGFINGDETLPRFSFPAYTGDTTVELVSKQLIQGDYKDNNRNLPRGQPFGKPQIAVVTIGGNDAELSNILNDCIYLGWRPGDCQATLSALQKEIDDGTLRDKVNYALYQVAHTGRESGGANPRESFQVYVPSYITFFNEANTECDSISWSLWPWRRSWLTTQLRQQLNRLTTQVNAVIKAAAEDLERMGVIFVEGLEDAYNGHRFCEPGHTNQQMVDYETWFWSQYAPIDTPSEGPGDPNNPYPADDLDPAQLLLDFIFPGDNRKVAEVSETSPPWEWEGAEKFPTFNDLLLAISNAEDINSTAVPFNLKRSFHPKATAFAEHKTLIFAAVANNRDAATSDNNGANYTERCKDWDIKEDRLLISTFKLDDLMTVQDDGYVECFGHISAPTQY
ncbi:hypothetical protein DL765_001464 [Monosporascus sp. GIB2]|nr:hypothetical protein DL765_001464 [Monosporascus sp. GIB2]